MNFLSIWNFNGTVVVDYYKRETGSDRVLTIRLPFELTARDNRHICIAWALAKAISDTIIGGRLIKPSEGYKIDMLNIKYKRT